MAKLGRAAVVLLIALLAGWSVARAAGPATMPHDMAAPASHDEDATDTAHCQGFDPPDAGDGIGAFWQIACVSPVLADLAADAAPAPAAPVTTLSVSVPTAHLHGRRDPPEPFPPRDRLLA